MLLHALDVTDRSRRCVIVAVGLFAVLVVPPDAHPIVSELFHVGKNVLLNMHVLAPKIVQFDTF